MAESALFSIASKLLSTIDSPSFRMAYERSASIWAARDELEKLSITIKGIQAVLLDAEKKKEGSAAVHDWMQRVRVVLYDADDLFDEIAVEQLLQMQMKASNFLKKVRVSASKLNPLVKSSSLFTRRLRAIRKSLFEISQESAKFGFAESRYEEPMGGIRKGVGTGWLVDPELVIGRDDDLKAVVRFLLDDDANAYPSVCAIAIVGVGGVGKSTLAQLVYNNKEVQNYFEKRWWACISYISDQKEVTRKIFQLMTGKSLSGLSLDHLQSSIKQLVSTHGKFLLVLDDLWDDDCRSGQNLMSLLSSDGAKGSKIIVTTRSVSVARAMDAAHTYSLDALSSHASWELFTRIAFTREQLNDPNWNNLGRKIVKKCAGIPLAIRCVASLLYTKSTKEEWKSILDQQVYPSQVYSSADSIMPALKLSYDNLPSHLKQCFAYCSLFPEDYSYSEEQLTRLWIAQGFVRPKSGDTYEAAGKACFMELLRRSFFQDKKEDENGEIFSCKMHDLIHDLAIEVTRGESMMLTHDGGDSLKTIRHLSIAYQTDDSCETLPSLLDANRQMRSSLIIKGGSLRQSNIKQLTYLRCLRAIDLRYLNIEVVPRSIGELKHLRYLNLAGNNFTCLPQSITKLVNLLTFEASSCVHLEALPADFRKLINLRHLGIKSCVSLRHMPPGIQELTSLQHLSSFKVGKKIDGVRSSRLDALAGLQLKGKLEIIFDDDIDNGDEDECWQIPTTLQVLEICNYPGVRIPSDWYQGRLPIPSLLPKLERLMLHNSSTIKHLPPLSCLPYLKALHLSCLVQLEYIEKKQDENESEKSAQLVDCAMLFFPCLEDLKLTQLPKLKAWSREVEAPTVEEEPSTCTDLPPYQMPSFPLLSTLEIGECPMLNSMPPSPRLRTISLALIGEELVQQILSLCCHSLETIRISGCDSLNSFRGETLTSLQHLELTNCDRMKNMHLPLPQLNVLEELVIRGCPQLKLWGEKEGVDWESLTNLCLLSLDEIPDVEMLPSWLQHQQSLGKLEIRGSL